VAWRVSIKDSVASGFSPSVMVPQEMFLDFLQMFVGGLLRIAHHREGVTPKWRRRFPVEIGKNFRSILLFDFIIAFNIEINNK